jgi:hypothetical protein
MLLSVINKFKLKYLNILILILLIFSPIITVEAYSSIACIDKDSQECLNINSIKSGCISGFNLGISAKADYQFINAFQCTKFKQYLDNIKETALKYSTPKLKLNEFIIAGIISRESNFGALTSDCNGYGDGGRGHGLAQIDSGNFPNKQPYQPQGIAIDSSTKKYGKESFVWSNCKDSIAFIGAHLLGKAEQIEAKGFSNWLNQIEKVGVSTKTKPDGSFEDSRASDLFMSGTIIAYNAGVGGLNNCSINKDLSINEGCSTNKYLTGVLDKSTEFFECLNNRRPAKEEVLAKTTNQNKEKLEACMNKIKSNNDVSNVPSNYDFSNEVKKFISSTSGSRVDSPVEGEQTEGLNGQCVSLVKAYQKSIRAITEAWAANYPRQKFREFNQSGNKAGFRDNDKYRVATITDFDKLEVGDIMISDHDNNPSDDTVSHTGIFISKTQTNWTMYDQNTNTRGKIAGTTTYPKKDFIGAFRYLKK